MIRTACGSRRSSRVATVAYDHVRPRFFSSSNSSRTVPLFNSQITLKTSSSESGIVGARLAISLYSPVSDSLAGKLRLCSNWSISCSSQLDTSAFGIYPRPRSSRETQNSCHSGITVLQFTRHTRSYRPTSNQFKCQKTVNHFTSVLTD